MQALLIERVAPHGGPLDIEVTGGCGAVEVRVAGPSGELRLPFDRAELNPAYALRVVSHAVERYGTSLDVPGAAVREPREKGVNPRSGSHRFADRRSQARPLRLCEGRRRG